MDPKKLKHETLTWDVISLFHKYMHSEKYTFSPVYKIIKCDMYYHILYL